MIQFQTNVAMPPRAIKLGRRAKYPWRVMPVGGSFFIPANETKLNSLTSLKAQAQKATKFKFEIRAFKRN